MTESSLSEGTQQAGAAAPDAPPAAPPDPIAQKISETVGAIQELEAQEAYLARQLEQARMQIIRLRGYLDGLIEVRQVAVSSNGATPAPTTPSRPGRGKPRRT